MAVGGLGDRLKFILEMDPSNAVAAMRKVGDTADKELGKTDDRLNKIGGRMQVAGAGAVAFAGVAGAALISFAKASEEANLAQVQLQNSIDNSPELAGASADAFNDLATAIQSKTAADGDQIVSAMAMLGTFHQTQEQIQGITPLVVDYSRKFGVDLVTAATQVGKALDGNIGTLQRVGINIDEAAYATDRYSAVTDALRDNVGGFAEAEGATFAGSLERLKNQLGDVAEGIGVGVVDAFTDMIGPVQSAAEAFTHLDAGTQSTIGKFAAYGTAAVGVAGATSFAIGSIIKMRDNFKEARDSIQAFVGGGGLGRVATVAVPAVGALGLFAAALQTQSQRAEEAKVRVSDLAGAIRTTGSVAEATTAQFERGELFEGLQLGAQEMTELLARIGVGLDDLQRSWDDNAATTSGFTDALRTARAEGTITLEEFDSLRTSVHDLTTRVTEAKGESAAQAEVLGDVTGATDGATEATGENTGAVETNTAAIQENIDKLKERSDAIYESLPAELQLREAQIQSRDELASYNEVMNDSASTADQREQAGIDLAQQFIAESEAARNNAETQATAAGRADTATREGVDAQIQSLFRLAGSLEPGSPVRVQLEDYIRRLNNIPTNITTTVRINPQYGQGTSPLPSLGQFADGGVVPGPSGAPVPILAHAGEVVLNPEQQQAAAAAIIGGPGGGGDTYVFAPTIHALSADPIAIRDTVVAAIDSWVRDTGQRRKWMGATT